MSFEAAIAASLLARGVADPSVVEYILTIIEVCYLRVYVIGISEAQFPHAKHD